MTRGRVGSCVRRIFEPAEADAGRNQDLAGSGFLRVLCQNVPRPWRWPRRAPCAPTARSSGPARVDRANRDARRGYKARERRRGFPYWRGRIRDSRGQGGLFDLCRTGARTDMEISFFTYRQIGASRRSRAFSSVSSGSPERQLNRSLTRIGEVAAMVVRRRLRAVLFPLALYCVSGSIGGYFVWHAVNGERGLKTKEDYERKIASLQVELRGGAAVWRRRCFHSWRRWPTGN